jgi:hypothetical protein
LASVVMLRQLPISAGWDCPHRSCHQSG